MPKDIDMAMFENTRSSVYEKPQVLSPSIEAREATAEEEVEHRNILSGCDLQHFEWPTSASSRAAINGQSPAYHATRGQDVDTGLKDPLQKTKRAVTQIRAGLIEKPFFLPTSTLLEISPYFDKLIGQEYETTGPDAFATTYLFPDLDPFSFELFDHWTHGGQLEGPSGFFSMNHYLGLYVIAWLFQIESLRNTTMDLIRRYYRENDMTAPPFRLEYIYKNTSRPCLMREFLVSTAAYRAASAPAELNAISPSMQTLLHKGGDLAQDYSKVLCRLVRNGGVDVRRDNPCNWHEHHYSSPADCEQIVVVAKSCCEGA